MKLILGSSSPRRKEILQFFSVPFEQIASDFDESLVAFDKDPACYVSTLSQKKGNSLLKKHPDKQILSADTVVYCEGKIYNKPIDKAEAKQFLQELSGKWHSVYTALTLSSFSSSETLVEETKILFYPLLEDAIELYLSHINFLDKAGGYAIQQGGSIVVQKIIGCYYNVMGLPIGALRQLLHNQGIDLWKHLKIL